MADEAEQNSTAVPSGIRDALDIAGHAACILNSTANEAGVRGSIIEKTHDFLKAEMQPTVMLLKEPGTGIEVYGIPTKAGISIIPNSAFDVARTRPRFRDGTATLLSLDSFIDHVNRFKDDDSAVFADNNRSNPKLTAVLDYHREGAEGETRFGLHRSAFSFPLSDEWKTWTGHNKKTFSMKELAAFLEDNIINVLPLSVTSLTGQTADFVDALGGVKKIAEPNALMSLATGMKIFETSNVSEAVSLASGEVAFTFETEHKDAAGKKLNMPTMFVIGIPVFKNGPPYQIIARLRYDKIGPQIAFFYELWRTDIVFDAAFDEAIERVKEETGLPVLLGHDEVFSPVAR